jgi:hypothetical protein
VIFDTFASRRVSDNQPTAPVRIAVDKDSALGKRLGKRDNIAPALQVWVEFFRSPLARAETAHDGREFARFDAVPRLMKGFLWPAIF